MGNLGRVLPLLVSGDEREGALNEARALPRLRLSSREVSDLIMLAMGAFSSLQSIAQGHAEVAFVLAVLYRNAGIIYHKLVKEVGNTAAVKKVVVVEAVPQKGCSQPKAQC